MYQYSNLHENNLTFYQTDIQNVGYLQVNVVSTIAYRPIVNAKIEVYNPNDMSKPIKEAETDAIGRTENIELPAPPPDYSSQPTAERPYNNYNIRISVPGFETFEINGVNIFPGEVSVQNAALLPLDDALGTSVEFFVIPDNTLYGDYPPKIVEAETKPVDESGEIVLSRVVVPEYIVVHDGPPTDNSAKNYYVKYKDYIKNVASSEIYATWPEATIIANVLAIQSFTLNRVYTEWYRNQGYNFTITSSTAFDHKWILERNIFQNISRIVDTIFANYLSRPNVRQPILTQYCDGQRVSCPNWMTQWGSKYLGDTGYSAIEILRYFYGDTIYINTAEEISGVPASWPGGDLSIGSRSDKVRQMQNQLNVISRGYPLVPKTSEDGVFGSSTERAVKVFQEIFGLPATGIVDFPTWYKISEVYVGVSRIAELV